MYTVRPVTAEELLGAAERLGGLLADTVDGGASVGFLAPLDPGTAADWWRALAPDVGAGRLLLWVAHPEAGTGSGSGSGRRIAGTVQLRPASTANGRHRAEVAKLMVHRADRGHGLAGRLLAALEEEAVGRGIRTLVLDTETDSPAERLYAAAGWTRVGTVPDFATDPAGVPHATTVFYKALRAAGSPGR
ncbi:L-amino acid N-acyltransferase YncA [Streptomyces sp. TLI_053]|uniref:GNAT family N-acetyltransferase n=1 Tax=Streptomyces sp. TLI_053 TaxID=1855352 RepID=UPI00087AEC3E|nr:GNAT family N-acetyltransferase [Streptomyces sp. TLI_053]SDT35949.1 L-amino acid N-acyltransferase YncA [Streptomyces sp. TLI_053]